ncbi:exosome complex component RRP41 [Schistosoma japonicum]|nr:exosome complex component RRP41 [Schistosoma japonicum]
MAEIFYNGRRVDGRRPNELRRVHCQFGSGNSDGIVFLHQGNTKVIASVVGPHAPRTKGDGNPDGATIICQFTKPPFASTSGERRKVASNDRSANDFSTAIEEIFSCVVRTEKYPMSQIDIFLEVIQSDGSEFACAVNATTLALTDAGIEMHYLVSAATVGLWGSRVFADLCRFEENPHLSQLTVVCLPDIHQLSEFSTEEQTSQSKVQPQILHTRLSSWLPVERLQLLITEAVKVAQTLHNEFSYWLRGRVRSGMITR